MRGSRARALNSAGKSGLARSVAQLPRVGAAGSLCKKYIREMTSRMRSGLCSLRVELRIPHFWTAVLVFWVALCCPAQEAESFGWVDFAPGSYVRLQVKTVSSSGLRAESSTITVRQTLISKDGETVTLEEEVTGANGETQKRRIPAPARTSAVFAGAKDRKPGSEVIKVAGMQVDCFTVEFRKKVMNKNAATKVWLSKEIPGGVARSFTITEGDDPLISIIEVLSFEAIRAK